MRRSRTSSFSERPVSTRRLARRAPRAGGCRRPAGSARLRPAAPRRSARLRRARPPTRRLVQRRVDAVVVVDAEELQRLARRAVEDQVAAAGHHDDPVAQGEVLRRVRDQGDAARRGRRARGRAPSSASRGPGPSRSSARRGTAGPGRPRSSEATPARLRWPPESEPIIVSACCSSASSSSASLDRRVERPSSVASAGSRRLGRVAERLAHGEQRVDDLVLRHVADVGQAGGDRLAVDGDAPARRAG